jgi:hypothetical protein
VGDTEILAAEVISSRELLLLGRETGRTTLIVWFANGSSREYRLSVQDLHPERPQTRESFDRGEKRPDRDALVLTGVVPTPGVTDGRSRRAQFRRGQQSTR